MYTRCAASVVVHGSSLNFRGSLSVLPAISWISFPRDRPVAGPVIRTSASRHTLSRFDARAARIKVIPEFERPPTAGSAHESSNDTIEVELTGEQQLALSRAAEETQRTGRSEESTPVLLVPEYESSAYTRTARIDRAANVTFAVAVLGIAVVFLWPASGPQPRAPVPAVTSAAPLAAEVLPAGPEPLGAPVRIRNAFDAREMFEFPHATNESDARKAVARLLLNRAQERRAERLALRQATKLQPDRGAPVQQPEVLVTRLARAKEALNGTN